MVHTNFRIPVTAPSGTAANGPLTPSGLASSSVDLRWIAARVLTPVSYAATTDSPTGARPVVSQDHLMAGIAESKAATAEAASINHTAAVSLTVANGANYAALLATLRSWQKANSAAR